MMPVEELPDASWITALALGFLSAVFDNIPLTKLCLDQGHYDWGMLAYSVGFGGSMIWFGSSAGVAITNKFPESRNVFLWVKNGWHVAVAYIIGFFTLYLLLGWEPADTKEHKIINCPVPGCPMANKPEGGRPGNVGYQELIDDSDSIRILIVKGTCQIMSFSYYLKLVLRFFSHSLINIITAIITIAIKAIKPAIALIFKHLYILEPGSLIMFLIRN